MQRPKLNSSTRFVYIRNILLTLILRGALMRDLTRFDEAVSSLTAAIALKGDVPEALHERGLAFMAIGKFAEAISDFERAVSLKPDFAEAYSDLGCAFTTIRQLETATENLRKALEIDPRHVAALNNLGSVFVDLDRPLEALGYFDRAIEVDPGYAEAHLNKAVNKLRLGDLQGGWIEYEWRWKCPSQNLVDRSFDKPLWLGAEPIAGKVVLLHNDQGLGDALQFCRYVPLLKARGADIILEIDGALNALFAKLPGISRCFAKGARLPTFDFHCPLTSLPLAFSTTLDTIPSEVPYLPKARDQAGPQLGPSKRPRIGLVWSGNPNHLNDHNRSLPFGELLPLLDGVAAQFVSCRRTRGRKTRNCCGNEATSSISVRRCATSPIPPPSLSSSTSSFQWTPASFISPAASAGRSGSCCPIFPIGGGYSMATTRPGTPPHDCSARPQCATGRRSWNGFDLL